MKRIRQHAVLVALVITLAVFGRAAFFARRAGAQNSPALTLQTEIAQVESRVDALEGEALTQAGQVYPGAPEAVVVLGKLLFFDKNLSVNRNTACAFCHIPETGFQGGIEIINRMSVNQPGSVRTRFSLRKPPSAAYAALSPPLHYPTKPGEAKCSDCFIGGNFWDLRATGLKFGNPSASQAQGSPINPTEMANREPACVVRRISQRPYRTLFEQVFGPRAFDIHWPANVDSLCSLPNDNPQTRIGSEVPGPNDTPWIVPLGTADRVRAQETYDLMARAIAAFEASPEVSPFSSKFDAFLKGNAKLSPAEMSGYALFNGQGRCFRCHVDPKGDPRPLFTDNTTSNLGIPKNPALAYYTQTKPDQYGYIGDPEGLAFVDLGVGGFLRSPENGNDAWRSLASNFDGRFRTVTARNADKRLYPEFLKAYGQTGYFKSLKEFVHFYNTRDTLPHCEVHDRIADQRHEHLAVAEDEFIVRDERCRCRHFHRKRHSCRCVSVGQFRAAALWQFGGYGLYNAANGAYQFQIGADILERRRVPAILCITSAAGCPLIPKWRKGIGRA